VANPHTRRIDSSIGPIALVLLTIAGFTLGGPALAQSSRAADEVVAIRELELKPGIDIAEFERFVTSTYNPGWDGALTGVRGYIAKADRGVHKGRYAFVLIFDSVKTRNAIFPKEGGGASEQFQAALEKPLGLIKQLDKYIEPGTFSAYTDYVSLR